MTAPLLDRAGIQALLPHRPPFLLLDEVLGAEPGATLTARFTVDPADPVLAGHFPGDPIYPGALIAEAMAQAAVLLLLLDPAHRDRLWLAGGADGLRFRRPVRPGDVVTAEVKLVRVTASVALADVRATVADTLVAKGRIIAGSVKRPAVPGM